MHERGLHEIGRDVKDLSSSDLHGPTFGSGVLHKVFGTQTAGLDCLPVSSLDIQAVHPVFEATKEFRTSNA